MEDPRSAAHPGRDEDRATMGVDPILVSPTPSPRRIAIEQPPMRIGRVGGNHGNTMPVPRHRIGEAAREGTDPGGLGAIKIAEQQEAHQRWLYPIRIRSSEAQSVGKESVGTGRTRGSPDNKKKKKNT